MKLEIDLLYTIPPEIIKAAIDIDTWMKMNGHNKWELMGICSRNHAIELAELKELNKYNENLDNLTRMMTKEPFVVPENLSNKEFEEFKIKTRNIIKENMPFEKKEIWEDTINTN